MTIPVLGVEQIRRSVTPAMVVEAVRSALIAHAQGRTMVPPPIHLTFPEADGDSHVKAGWITGSDHFTVKVASGFYRNTALGTPSNQGLVCVFSASTGEAVAILDDGGLLTAWRTAAAGALITDALAAPDATALGVFGTGQQAELQVAWLARLRSVPTVLLCGRSPAATADLCRRFVDRGIDSRPASAAQAAGADIVLTTTAATAPVLAAADVAPQAHVTGIGTDMPHKNELPAALFARAALIATDDHRQCLEHGDFGHAVRAGLVAEKDDVSIGSILLNPPGGPTNGISIADLTGVGALDAAVASGVVAQLLG